MIKYLEDLLREKTKDSQSEILLAQWNYDKKLIPSALQAVSNLFPHYSLHDESHSITIINNIVRVIGKENIAKLSAIDIWLILEASYCHDIGMVVPSDKLLESLNSTYFLEFFRDLIQDHKNGLHEFADKFEIIDNKIKIKSDIFSLELIDSIKFILAEYFRRVHADRSKDIINNPLKELSLLSPRSVIPSRIFKILGDICSCHTKEFTDVMNLPFCEVGIDIDDAHPRFIACLLRIGDLLDLDNNRFSEVMLRTLSRIPIDTLNHKSKHLSIESFRVDRDRIEITASCNEYETASITQHWFNYLNTEITLQMVNWNNIVPFKDLGYLPTIGSLKVDLTNFELIDGKKKPKFTVDTDKALNLLQGAGIYDGAYQCIREILQNAVDATLIRIWLDYEDIKDFSSPNNPEFKKLAKDYPIQINIIEKGIEGDLQNWQIEIEDNGIGISDYDLKFLMNTGSSSKNKEKARIIEKMPIWMQPSGTFGIGFQSIFMLTDVVKIETKNYFDEQFQIIELNSANSKKDGDILIQKKKTTHSKKPGTKIIINHKIKAVPNRVEVKLNQGFAHKIFNNYDPFSDKSFDIEIGKVVDEIFEFSSKSPIFIRLKIDNKEVELPNFEEVKFPYFDSFSSLEFNIIPGGNPFIKDFVTYYKNQKIENNYSVKFLDFEVNINKENASKVLTLNRNKIKAEFKSEFLTQFYDAAFRVITKDFNSIFVTEKDKSVGSIFLNYYYSHNPKYDISEFNQWENYKLIETESVGFTIKEIFNTIDTFSISTTNDLLNDAYEIVNNNLSLKVGNLNNFQISDFFVNKVQEYLPYFNIKHINVRGREEIVFTKLPQENFPISKTELISLIIDLKKDFYTSRVLIPCIKEFNVLRLKNNAFKSYVNQCYVSNYLAGKAISYPKMLSPFIRRDSGDEKFILKELINDELLNWVYDNRYDSKTTKEEIREGYSLFCNEINPILI